MGTLPRKKDFEELNRDMQKLQPKVLLIFCLAPRGSIGDNAFIACLTVLARR